jgi:hypothetical protein
MRRLGFLLLVAGCGNSGGGDTCTPLEAGEWTIDGPAMGMAMGATVEMDVEACEFTFSDWSMEMGSLPIGGALDGTALTLDGDAHWSSCAGTVADDGASAEGVCDDDGSAFTMVLGALQSGS